MAARTFVFAAFSCVAQASASCDGGGGERIADADEPSGPLQAARAERSGRRRSSTSRSTGCVQPSGSYTTQQVNVGGAITSISAAGNLDVYFSVCASDSVSVWADDAVMPQAASANAAAPAPPQRSPARHADSAADRTWSGGTWTTADGPDYRR